MDSEWSDNRFRENFPGGHYRSIETVLAALQADSSACCQERKELNTFARAPDFNATDDAGNYKIDSWYPWWLLLADPMSASRRCSTRSPENVFPSSSQLRASRAIA